jgi:hypothetical protein
MFSRYLGTLLLVLVVVCGVLSQLPFATRSQVRTGQPVTETWTNEFTLGSPSGKYYVIDDALKRVLEQSITFAGAGPVQVTSADVQITPKDVSWEENKTKYTATGAGMVAHVTWQIPDSAKDGERGDVHVEFPKIPGAPSYTTDFHHGAYQKTGDGRWLFREASGYHGSLSLVLARMLYSFSVALPVAILLQGIPWSIYLWRVKKARVAELQPPPGAPPLPRTFYPNPIAEWFGWMMTMFIFGFVGSMFAAFVLFDNYLSSSFDGFIIVIDILGLAVGLFVVWMARRSVVTVRVDPGEVSVAKGRGEPRWQTASWSQLRCADVKSRTYKGQTSYWVELVFPDGKKRKVPQSIIGFDALRDLVLERYATHRLSPPVV